LNLDEAEAEYSKIDSSMLHGNLRLTIEEHPMTKKRKLGDTKPGPKPKISRNREPEKTHEVAAEQMREASESAKAKSAEASIRGRMIDIGRGNQQAGRQGS